MSATDQPTPVPPRQPGPAWSRWVLAAALLAALGIFYALGGRHYLSFQYLHEHLSQWRDWATEHLPEALLVYFGVYVTVAAFSLPAAGLLSITAGVLFGLWWGVLVVLSAATVGATLAFLTSRYLFRDWVRRRFGARLGAIDRGVKREGAYYLLTVRLVPLFPFFLINLAMGVTSMRVWTFAWVSFLGMLPGSFVFVNAGNQAGSIQQPADLLTLPVLGSFALLALVPLALRLVVGWLRNKASGGRQPPVASPPAGG